MCIRDSSSDEPQKKKVVRLYRSMPHFHCHRANAVPRLKLDFEISFWRSIITGPMAVCISRKQKGIRRKQLFWDCKWFAMSSWKQKGPRSGHLRGKRLLFYPDIIIIRVDLVVMWLEPVVWATDYVDNCDESTWEWNENKQDGLLRNSKSWPSPAFLYQRREGKRVCFTLFSAQ